jgi:hypothetical protein
MRSPTGAVHLQDNIDLLARDRVVGSATEAAAELWISIVR